MKNKFKNGIMLVILASAMIACNGGSGSSSQSQSPNLNVQLPQPEVLDSISSDAAKAAPFLGAVAGFAKEFIPGATGILSIVQLGVGFVNLFEPSIGFAQVMSKLSAISTQINQLESQMTLQLDLSDAMISDIQTFETQYLSNQLKQDFTTIDTAYANINNAYGKFTNEEVFGNVSYHSPIESMYWYAYSKCNSSQIVDEVVNFNQMEDLNSADVAFYDKFIYQGGTFWSTFASDQGKYFKTLLSVNNIPSFDIALYFNYYNSKLFNAMTQLYGAWDELRLMQLAQAAYYYACPGQISSKLTSDFLNNLSPSPAIADTATLIAESSGSRYASYKDVAEAIYSHYNSKFYGENGLRSLANSNLKPITNQEFVNYINGTLFSSIGTSLFASNLFAESIVVNGIPLVTGKCSANRFKLESDNFVHVGTNCLIESNNLEFSYRTISNKIPYSESITSTGVAVKSTYGYANLYYDESRQTIKSPAYNLNIPVSSTASGYANSTGAVELSYMSFDLSGSEAITGQPSANNRVLVNVESDIYVYGQAWTNDPISASDCGTAPDGAVMCAGAQWLAFLGTNHNSWPGNGNTSSGIYGYNTIFNIGPMPGYGSTYAQANAAGTWTTQAYYAASVKGHIFYIQYLITATYVDGTYLSGTSGTYPMTNGAMYVSLRCATDDCRSIPLNSSANPMQQLSWNDGTVIQLNNNDFSEWGNINIDVSNIPNNIVTQKRFQFESDSQFATWMESPTHLHHKAYLNGRIKYTLKAGVESTPIFVSKNSAYRLAYIANGGSGSLQIQSNNNDGTWSTASTLATAPNGATDLYLNSGDVMLVNSTANGESVIWSVSQQYRANNIQWAPDIYAEIMLTSTGQLNIYGYDKNNQAGVRGTSPDDANYSRLLWSNSNFPWASVNHGTLLQPTGSYTKSCSSISWVSPNLTASCLTAAGNNSTTSTLNYTACSGNSTVSNQNGVLTCDTLNKSRS